jgi:hypothetical protein
VELLKEVEEEVVEEVDMLKEEKKVVEVELEEIKKVDCGMVVEEVDVIK